MSDQTIQIRTRHNGQHFIAETSSLPGQTATSFESGFQAARELARNIYCTTAIRVSCQKPGVYLAQRLHRPPMGAAVSMPIMCALAVFACVPLIVFAIGYCSVWWDNRHLLRSLPNTVPNSAVNPRVESGASNHSPRAGALPARAAFKEETSCTNQ